MSSSNNSQMLSLPKIGLGMMSCAAFYGAPLEQPAVDALVKRALELGCNHFDTAEIYKSGDLQKPDTPDTVYNEVQLGNAIKAAGVERKDVVVATKFLPILHGNKCDVETVTNALENSLKRLQLDMVDLYYMHRVVSKEAMLEWVASAKTLLDAGKIRGIGLSEVPPAWLEEALKVAPIVAVQMEWSALSRALEKEVVPLCAKNNVTIVCYSPLSRNLLADPTPPAENDWRLGNPRWAAENFADNQKIIESLRNKADTIGASPAQLSLAWLYRKAAQFGVSICPIPGTTKPAHLATNVAALDFVDKLTDDTIAEIDSLKAKGERYAPQMMASTFEGL